MCRCLDVYNVLFMIQHLKALIFEFRSAKITFLAWRQHGKVKTKANETLQNSL